MYAPFSIKESFRFGWEMTRRHSALVFQVVLTLLALQLLSTLVQNVASDTFVGALAILVLVVASVVVGTGATLIGLILAKGEAARYADIAPSPRLVRDFVCASVMVGVISVIPLILGTVAGFMLLGVERMGSLYEGLLQHSWLPFMALGDTQMVTLSGVISVVLVVVGYLNIRFSMVRFAVVDGCGIIGSLQTSAALTKGVKWKLLGFLLLVGLLNIVGSIAFLVGLLITIPVSMLAYAHVYLKLKNRP